MRKHKHRFCTVIILWKHVQHWKPFLFQNFIFYFYFFQCKPIVYTSHLTSETDKEKLNIFKAWDLMILYSHILLPFITSYSQQLCECTWWEHLRITLNYAFFWDRISVGSTDWLTDWLTVILLCISGCPWTLDLSASNSQRLELQVCPIMPGPQY